MSKIIHHVVYTYFTYNLFFTYHDFKYYQYIVFPIYEKDSIFRQLLAVLFRNRNSDSFTITYNATKGLKKVNQAASQERAVNTTMLTFISAGGTQIPPVFVFRRKSFKPEMTRGGLTGRLGLTHRSGSINSETFLESLKHFFACTCCWKERLHQLLLDNHASHLDFQVIPFARDN